MRIAILGLMHEANSFAPHRIGTAELEAAETDRGEEILQRHAGGATTISGYLAVAERHPDVEAVPLMMTTLVPAGPLTADALASQEDELTRRLRDAGPFDGVLTVLHGAAVADGVDDLDGHLLRRFRDVVGPDVPIGVSLDLHANISADMCEIADVINTYRTNPHIDARQVGEEVAEIVIATIRGDVRPTIAFESLPTTINILRQGTSEDPMRSLLDEARLVMEQPGVLSASIAEGYPYADVPEMGMSVVVVTDNDDGNARQHARRLADLVWDAREHFGATAPDAEAAVREVAARSDGPTLLLDVGDNIGGGSPGDSVALLHAAQRVGLKSLLIIVNDVASARAAATAGIGARVQLSIGGNIDRTAGPAVKSAATVLATHDGQFSTSEILHAGFRDFDAGLSSAVRLDTGQTVILTSRACLPFTPVQLTTLGLVPADFHAIVAKGVHSPVAGYGPHVRSMVRVDTPGVTSADLTGFRYRRRRRPMLPFETDTILSRQGN